MKLHLRDGRSELFRQPNLASMEVCSIISIASFHLAQQVVRQVHAISFPKFSCGLVFCY